MELNYVDHTTVGMPCCSHNDSIVIETRPRADGSIRRRHKCRDCGERWTTVRPGGKAKPRRAKPARKRQLRKLTPEHVYRVLTEMHRPDKALAEEFGVVRQCIQQIRCGATWPDVFPELPRRDKWRICTRCRNWDGELGCGIGFPDPLEEGPSFAVDCDFYEV